MLTKFKLYERILNVNLLDLNKDNYIVFDNSFNDMFILKIIKIIDAHHISVKYIYYAMDKGNIIGTNNKDDDGMTIELNDDWVKGIKYKTDDLNDALDQLRAFISGTKFGI